jgi:hypothetical protein
MTKKILIATYAGTQAYCRFVGALLLVIHRAVDARQILLNGRRNILMKLEHALIAMGLKRKGLHPLKLDATVPFQ